jgi:hypothetical protein
VASLGEISLYWEAEKILAQAACEWIGIPIPEKDIEKEPFSWMQ